MVYPNSNWRNDPGLQSTTVYKKRFAILPATCQDGSRVWLKNYYRKYILWGYRSQVTDHEESLHEDKCEIITEAEFIVRKLTEGI
jgi:hypothetical protein